MDHNAVPHGDPGADFRLVKRTRVDDGSFLYGALIADNNGAVIAPEDGAPSDIAVFSNADVADDFGARPPRL